MARRRRSLPSRLLRAFLAAAAVLLLALLGLLVAFRWVPVPLTAFMVRDHVVALATRTPGYEFSHDWVAWERISPHAAVAVIAAEDQKFASHAGFDLESIDQALEEARRGGRMRGASTLSQQVAKNLFLWPGQSWLRKGLEAGLTVLVELAWPKRRILEVYLNSAEFGRGVWGIEAASRRFFDKSAADLNRHEAALLAAVLPNPIRLRVDKPSGYVRGRQQWILRQMATLGDTGYLDALEPGGSAPR